MTTKAAIKEFADAFQTDERDNGSEYVHLKDGPKKEEFRDFIREMHGGSLPDDSVYAEIERAAEHLTNYDEPDDDAIYEIEPDVYNNDLKKWLQNNPEADSEMEEVAGDYAGREYDFIRHVRGAQAHYRQGLAMRILEHFKQEEPEEIDEEA